MCLVTKEAPEFEAEAVMANNSFEKISLHALRGKYVLMFFYPLDFTFVCPSEILAFNSQVDALQKRNCELIGISPETRHRAFDRYFAETSADDDPDGGIVG